MPRTKRPAGTTVDRRNGRPAEIVEGGFGVVEGGRFDAPANLSDEALVLWDAYWADAVAKVHTSVDRGVLNRWITEFDRYLRLVAEADVSPLVAGSKGQAVANPLYALAERALAAAERCEKQLGIGGLNRSNLGIAVVAGQRSLADMNAKYGGADAGRPPEATQQRQDPRSITAG